MVSKTDLKKLQETLDYWIFIGIGDDIVKFKDHRKEYQHLVRLAASRSVDKENIPRWVNWYLKREMLKPLVLSYSFWSLLFK